MRKNVGHCDELVLSLCLVHRGRGSLRDGLVDGEIVGLNWSQPRRGPLVKALGDDASVQAVGDAIGCFVFVEIFVALSFFSSSSLSTSFAHEVQREVAFLFSF